MDKVKNILSSPKEMLGSSILLIGLTISLLSFLFVQSALYYFAFVSIVTGIIFLYRSIYEDLRDGSGSSFYAILSISLLLLFYTILRLNLLDFSLVMGDASDYFWSGVGSVTTGDNHGFFLPLTASLAGVGYELFGLKLTPMMTVVTYSATLPVLYLFLRQAGLKYYSAFISILFFALLPLPAWFSRTTFSEPLWQLLLLLLLLYSFKLLKTRDPSRMLFILLFILMGLALFSRGSSIFLFAFIVFLALFHFWRYQNRKILSIFVLLLFYFDALFAITLSIRTKYLIGWQFGHVVHGITLTKMMILMLSATLLLLALFYFLKRKNDVYRKINLPLIITLFALLIKVFVSYHFASMDSRFTFMDKLFWVEFDFAVYHFGYYFALLATLGLIYFYYGALKGRTLFLLFVVFDALFTIPFAMMDAYTEKLHSVFLYWHRYYFSEIFLMQFLAIVFSIGMIYQFVSAKIRNKNYLNPIFFSLIVIPFLLTFNIKLFTTVSENGYLTHASRFYEWVIDRTKGKRLYILYNPSINYTGYDLKKLTASAFPRIGVDIIEYRKNPALPQKIGGNFGETEYEDTLLLCLALKPCQFENKHVALLDQTYTSLKWITHNAGEGTTDIGAYLYRMEPTFQIGREYNITQRSKIDRKFFPPNSGWYKINRGWIWTSDHGKLFIPPLRECQQSPCTLKIGFEVFNATPKSPKEISFEIDGKEVDKIKVDGDKLVHRTILLPADKDKNGTFVNIKAPEAISPKEIHLSVDGRKLGLKMKSLIVKINNISR